MPTTSSDLTSHLDALLTRYLHLLDTHRTHHATGNSHFRTGLFSLTEANFRSPNRSTRYGQDLYDDKMQASLILDHGGADGTTASAEDDETDAGGPGGAGGGGGRGPEACFKFRTKRLPTAAGGLAKRGKVEKGQVALGKADGGTGDGVGGMDGERDVKRPLDEGMGENEREKRDVTETGEDGAATDDEKDELQLPSPPGVRDSTPAAADADANELSLLQDPIRQFGILVPPALRAAQSSFSKAVQSWVDGVAADVELQRLELEIRRTRKRMKKSVGSATGELTIGQD